MPFSGTRGPATAANFTVRSEAEWESVRQTIFAGRNPLPAMPSIDSSRDMAVGIALGMRPDSRRRWS
jgi:hypothetical protein